MYARRATSKGNSGASASTLVLPAPCHSGQISRRWVPGSDPVDAMGFSSRELGTIRANLTRGIRQPTQLPARETEVAMTEQHLTCRRERPASIVDLLSVNTGTDIDFVPERLGLTARTTRL